VVYFEINTCHDAFFSRAVEFSTDTDEFEGEVEVESGRLIPLTQVTLDVVVE
jgi:hypothetical protein